jgi:glycosyltransferase involved in cell wall biosynthesis
LRVGLVASGGFDRSGRTQVIPALLALVARLARRHEVHVFTLAQHPAGTHPLVGATVHHLATQGTAPGSLGMGMARGVARLVAAVRSVGRLDLLHGYMGLPAGVVTVLAARALRVPALVTFDGNELVGLPEIGYGLELARRRRWLRALVVRLAARITVCSRWMEGLARARGIVPEVIPLGVDRTLAGGPAAVADGPPWRLLQVASLNPVKDQRTLLAALALVRARARGEVHLDVVGIDTLGGAIQREAARLGIDRHVTFHGAIPADEVWGFHRRAHLLVQSSRHEGAAVAVLEAAACGVPTVGTAVGYVAEWAAAGAARAVPVADPARLADAVVDLLHDPAARRQLGEAARAWVAAHDADWTAQRFEDLYRSM